MDRAVWNETRGIKLDADIALQWVTDLEQVIHDGAITKAEGVRVLCKWTQLKNSLPFTNSVRSMT